ncbi:MAG: Uma2 family endonuclease [Acidimicrobiia bacterium]|nr:Uma2 family endonuclease [Acidimicrobiia bacterium]
MAEPHRDVGFFDDEFTLHSDDEVFVPESRDHRRIRELVALAAARALGHELTVDSNLNFYPAADARAIGPDVMVLPADALAPTATSYQQPAGGPTPSVVVEVPSGSDDVPSFHDKLRRYQRLGTVVYVLYAHPAEPDVTRLGPADLAPQAWLDRSCPELGGISFVAIDGQLGLVDHRGVRARSAQELLDTAEARAETAEARAERFAAQLRAAGLEPDA